MVTLVDARPSGSNWNALGLADIEMFLRQVWLVPAHALSGAGNASAEAKGQVPPKGVAVDSGGLESMVNVADVPLSATHA